MRKKSYYFIFIFICIFCCIIRVDAEETFSNTVCNIGSTDGLLYSNDWSFVLIKPPVKDLPSNIGLDKNKAVYVFNYSVVEITNKDSGISIYTGYSIGNVDNIGSDSKFANLGTGKDGMYSTDELIKLLNSAKCPNYIYAASSLEKQKIGFIFSSKKVDNAKEIFEKAGYEVLFEQNGGSNLDDENIKNFENNLNDMKSKLEEYKKGNWSEKYNEKCSNLTYFGGDGLNVMITYYEKYRALLPDSYDKSEAEKIYKEYKNAKCALSSSRDNNKDNDMDLSGCIIDKGTQSIIDWIMNLVRIGGVILLVVLGMLDFVKAAASGEQEEMKKSKSKFVKRLIACVVLFFVPIIVKILVGLVNLGSGESCKSNNTHQSNSGDTQNGGSEKS